eukprot:6412333-Alexandrium_andersonii.AAC.1
MPWLKPWASSLKKSSEELQRYQVTLASFLQGTEIDRATLSGIDQGVREAQDLYNVIFPVHDTVSKAMQQQA